MRDLKDDVYELINASDARELDVYVDWSRHDLKVIPRIDAQAESRQVVEDLEKKGYQPMTHEAAGGSGWGGWRQRTDRVLESLFPLAESRGGAAETPPLGMGSGTTESARRRF